MLYQGGPASRCRHCKDMMRQDAAALLPPLSSSSAKCIVQAAAPASVFELPRSIFASAAGV